MSDWDEKRQVGGQTVFIKGEQNNSKRNKEANNIEKMIQKKGTDEKNER